MRPRVESQKTSNTGISNINVQPGTVLENKPMYDKVYRMIQFNDVSGIKDLLTSQPDINVVEMRDARRFTVLSFCCYKNTEEMFLVFY